MFKNPLTKAAGSPSRSSRQPWILRLCVASIIATIAITALPSATAHAAYGPKTRMFDWNALGGGQPGDANTWLSETLRLSISARGADYPGMVTLQEVCRRQAEDMQLYMYEKGFGYFSFYTATSQESKCGVSQQNGQRNFGNVVWVWGAQAGSQWASPPFPNQYTSERRGMACIWPTPYGTQACSFHLANVTPAQVDCQFRDAMYWIESAYASGKRTVFGADANYPSGTPNSNVTVCEGYPLPTQLAYTYSTYWEADQYSGTNNQITYPRDSVKIDYVFIKKGWGGYFQDLSVTSSASDHKLLEAFLSW